MKKTFLLFVTSLLSLLSFAQFQLDKSFAGKGWRFTTYNEYNNPYDYGESIFLDGPNSYLAVVGDGSGGSVLTRLLSDGSIDRSYGEDGFSVPLPVRADGIVARQPDGKILITGLLKYASKTPVTRIFRLNIDGSLDGTFGTNGVAIADVEFYNTKAAIIVQSDGKILVAGETGAVFKKASLQRLYSDGTVDNSFGVNGIVTTEDEQVSGLNLQFDGKIVLGVSGSMGNKLYRLLSDGTFDVSFGSSGVVSTTFPLKKIISQSDGKTLIAWGSKIARFNVDGTPDNSFGSLGVFDFGVPNLNLTALLQRPDGEIVIGGYTSGTESAIDFIQIAQDGSLDNSFGNSGIVKTQFDGSTASLNNLVLDEEGKLAAIGTITSTSDGRADFLLLRYNADGTPDNTFGDQGTAIGFYLRANSENTSVATQSDGKIIVAGKSAGEFATTEGQVLSLTRYNYDGTIDNSFGSGGIVITDIPLNNVSVHALKITGENKLYVVAGGTIIRLNEDGSFDESFGTLGRVNTDLVNLIATNPFHIVESKLFIIGSSSDGQYYVLCYNDKGELDNTFGVGGKQIIPKPTVDFSRFVTLNSSALQADGKIVVSGQVIYTSNASFDFVLLRLLQDGTIDQEFGQSGYVVTDVVQSDYPENMIVQADGKIVQTGEGYDLNNNSFLEVVRYNSDGSLDEGFGNAGKAITSFSNFEPNWFPAAAEQEDGKILFSGSIFDPITNLQGIASVRLNSDGSPDNNFGEGGVALSLLTTSNIYANDGCIADGRLYLAGYLEKGFIAAYSLENNISLACPGNVIVNNDPGRCSALINNIDPIVSPEGTAVNYTLSGATTGSGTGSASGLTFNEGITTVSYSVASDPSISCSFTVTVNNAAPIINSLTVPVDPVAVNTSTTLSGAYTDNNATTASINWGDSPNTLSVSISSDPFAASHTYTSAGVYTASVTVTDACNVSSDPVKSPYIVVYDPNAGFVTGNGSINSPVVPDLQYMQVAGIANFGFVSRYQKGKTVPMGNTQFEFNTGGLYFVSTNYDWLVIAGSRAQFKGSGTINGSGDYGFMLTAVDGNLNTTPSPDLFRIKIWDRGTGTVVYDNQNGTADDGSLTPEYTQLAGGSVVIHVPKGGKPGTLRESYALQQAQQPAVLAVTAFPNPSAKYFTLSIKTDSDKPVTIKVLDVLGRTVEVKQKLPASSTLQLGRTYRLGSYFVEVTQGSERKVVKLVKTPD